MLKKTLNKLIDNFKDFGLEENELNTIFEKIKENASENDRFGLDVDSGRSSLKYLYPLSKKYFKTRLFNKENVPNEPVIVVANHTGQVAIDAILLGVAFATEVDSPRILRAMVDRFVGEIPFFGPWVQSAGGVLGDRTNCINLLKTGGSIMVFPEGVKGISKDTKDFYSLKHFTRGFYRIAMSSNVKILPVSIVGAEEFYPYVYHPRKIAKFLGLPALPLTPTWPILGPLGALPLPSPIDIYIGKPYTVPKKLYELPTDEAIGIEVDLIKKQIHDMIDFGIRHRRPFFANQK